MRRRTVEPEVDLGNLNDPYGISAELDEEMKKRKFTIDVSTEVNMPEAKRQLLNRLVNFSIYFAGIYKQDLQSSIDTFKKSEPGGKYFSDKMSDFIEEKELDIPTLKIFDKIKGEAFLISQGLNIELNPDAFLYVFDHSKPLGHFWQKGNNKFRSSLDGSFDAKGEFIEWGTFYRKIMPTVWGLVDKAQREYDLKLERLNEYGEHNPGRYYYLWEATDSRKKAR